MSTFQRPLRLADYTKVSIGDVIAAQIGTLNFDITLTQNLTFRLPSNARIVDILVDVITAYDSLTSATLSVGTAAAGTQFASGVNAKTTGRVRPTFTTAQLTAMLDVGVVDGTGTTVYATVTSVGQPTVGATKVQVLYVAPAATSWFTTSPVKLRTFARS